MNILNPFIVPAGIRFISDIPNFSMPPFPCIVDKKLTGCGFTEWVLRDNIPTILVSPRTNLLKNKEAQHNLPIFDQQGNIIGREQNVYYAKCIESLVVYDKDLQKPKEVKEDEIIVDYNKFKDNLEQAIFRFWKENKPIKICVTYDSFRKVREIISSITDFSVFRVIVDEFQSIFIDGRFKSDTEIDLLTALDGINQISYVSATPMMKDYLEMVPEFKDISYLELDWISEDSSRIIHPEIIAKPTRNINETAKKIITEFKSGKFHKKSRLNSVGIPIEVVEAKELVIFVNSVRNICDIIRQNNLQPEEVDVICSDTSENRRKVRDSFRKVFNNLGRKTTELPSSLNILSEVPVPDPITGKVNSKPITFCTKTVYLGADFYNEAARCIVLSDATVECMAVDITMDLPQIGGRFRCDLNPWKNCIEIWFREGNGPGDISEEQFKEKLQKKVAKTENLLLSYNSTPDKAKHDVATEYEKIAKIENYKDHYVAVNKHSGSDLKPQFNQLVMIAEQRAFDIQQKDYANRFSVFNRIDNVFGKGTSNISYRIQQIQEDLDKLSTFPDKMKSCCDLIYNGEEIMFIPEPFRTYIQTLGVSYILSGTCHKYKLDQAMESRGTTKIYTPEDLEEIILEYFKEGQEILKSQLKNDLGKIYQKLGISKTPKAIDIEKWFEIKELRMTIEGKRFPGYRLISRK